jgi:3-oxoacyl-[acyl-carrier protein] reductase
VTTDEDRQDNSPVALVTGARKGIGRHLSEHLVRSGYRVIGCSRNPADFELENFRHLQVDVSKEDEVTALFRTVRKEYRRLDAVINNAGFASMNHVLLTPLATMQRVLESNVCGTFLVSREAAKLMRKQGAGRIVNFTSAVVPLRLGGEAVYMASKRAVEMLSQAMAREVAELGITVNVVGPGPTATDMIRGVPRQKIDQTLDQFAIKKLTTFEDIANVVDFFLRAESSAVTGQIIYLNGVFN